MTNKKMTAGLLLGGVAYWLFDAATDVFIFQEGAFRARAFSPPPHEIVMRSIIIALLAITSYVVLISMREKKTQSDLREKEKLLSESQRIAHIGSWLWEIATGNITWTEETYRIYGRSPETFVLSPESFLGLLHPGDRPAMREWIKTCLAGEDPGDLEFRTILPGGGVRFLKGRGGLERDAIGKPVRMIGAVQDITEHRRVDENLRHAERRYRALFDEAPVMYVLTANQEGGPFITDCNRAFLSALDYAREEVVGRPLADLYTPASRRDMRDNGYQRALQGRFGGEERELVTRAGAIVSTFLQALPETAADGAVTGTRAAFIDITERKRAEEELRRSNERFDFAVKGTNDGIWDWDIATNTSYFSPRFCELLGYGPDELAQKPATFESLPHPEDREWVFDRVRRHLEERLPYEVEYRLRAKNGEYRWFRARGQAAWDGSGKPFRMAGSITDITEHRKLEEQLRQSQKMEAIGQLAGGVAHDFNNILSAIIGYGHLSTMALGEDHPARHYIDQILQGAERATALTQSLLTFSRKQPVKRELLDLNDVIGAFEKFLLRLLREDIEMQTRLSGDELLINADRGQVEQVIMNLVTNARDAMPSAGKLTITTGVEVLDDAFLSAHGFGRPGEYAMITVSDTGVGMDEETKRRIFEPFFTTKEQGKGTGLGLATVYGIVKAHDGFINVYSEPGKGTAFHIYLPRVRSSARAEKPAGQTPVPLKGGAETILLAEDDASLRKMTSTVLTHMGYTVIEVENGREAVGKFIKHKDSIRLVILDGIMPGMNGKEAYHEIISLAPEARCIFMSGYAEDVFTKDGIPQTDVEFMSKPVTPSMLLHKVREVLDR